MVILDFLTAAVIIVFSVLMGKVDLVFLITVTMMVLFSIAGVYQPSVQASVPALVSAEYFMTANSIINTISSFASLLGPVLGGIVWFRTCIVCLYYMFYIVCSYGTFY